MLKQEENLKILSAKIAVINWARQEGKWLCLWISLPTANICCQIYTTIFLLFSTYSSHFLSPFFFSLFITLYFNFSFSHISNRNFILILIYCWFRTVYDGVRDSISFALKLFFEKFIKLSLREFESFLFA